jgi:hypothetical protein
VRGLTPEEHAKLSFLVSPHETCAVSAEEKAVLYDLKEQGRVVRQKSNNPNFSHTWLPTPAGREALRLWPLMQALMEAA